MNLRFVDTHCHLGDSLFDNDLDEVMSKAMQKDVYIITSAITPDTWDKSLEISQRYSNCYLSAGLDPQLFKEVSSASDWIISHADQIISIGEIGIDHYRVRDHTERAQQEETFRQLIDIATDLGLPMQIHSRSAGKKALDILKSEDADMVHMHAFDGKASLARIASKEHGYYFSIPTSVVRSPQKRKLVIAIDIERLLLETDSPVLGASKGERNEPSNLPIALHETARILKREENELREIILENTLRVYSKIGAR
ncbi:MAG: TatD family hydrolase [Candidatus Thorarchaeota archaeon]